MSNKVETEGYVSLPYSRVLVLDPTGGYFAEVLELPGCFSQGDTPDEAIKNLGEAMEGWIEVALEEGQSIPPPLATAGYSGRVLLRLPKSLHKAAVRRAQVEGVSLNQYLVSAIAAHLEGDGLADRIARLLSSGSRMQVLQLTEIQFSNTSGAVPAPLLLQGVPSQLEEAATSGHLTPVRIRREERQHA